MEEIKDKRFGLGNAVFADGKHFVNCIFDGCTIHYNGGFVRWDNCHWNKPTTLMLGSVARQMIDTFIAMGFTLSSGSVALGN
ncbi:MAG: hypothetical protein WB997_12400 [Candidatus Acidiferrales bacterium]